MNSIEIIKLLEEYEILNRPSQEIIDEFITSKKLLPNFLVEKNLVNERQLYRFNQKKFNLNVSKIYDLKSFLIYGKTFPRFYISGDIFSVFPLKDSRIVISLCDVSGKGLEAGLLGFMLSYQINTSMHLGSVTPQTLLKKINALAYELFEDIKFATFSLMILDLLSGTIEYAAAGSPPLLHYKYRDKELVEVDTYNIPVGIEEDFLFKGTRIDFNPGDFVIVYSDGAYEQENRQGRQYGLERLKKSIRKNAKFSIRKLVWRIFLDLKIFSLFTKQADDTTYLVLKYKYK